MSKHQTRRSQAFTDFVDPEFVQALEGGQDHRLSTHAQAERKTRQLCRQVQRALNLALTDGPDREALRDLYVDEVTPAPDCGHLLVHVVAPALADVSAVMAALREDSRRLRSEVAAAITRKRAPELAFVPATAPGGPGD